MLQATDVGRGSSMAKHKTIKNPNNYLNSHDGARSSLCSRFPTEINCNVAS